MPLAVSSDDTILTWVRLDPCDPPQEILLEFFDGSGWEHRAFWGTANLLQGGAPNTAAHRRMGAMPPAGEWARLEIPASLVGVMNVHGMRFVLSDGNAWWDRVGHAPSQQALAASDARVASAGAAPRGHRRAWWARLLPVGNSDEAPINMSVGASYVSDSSTERRYSIYSPALQLLAETATTSASEPPIAHEYVWFGGEPLAQIETATGAVHYYFNDHLGAPVLTTDASGAVDWRVEREPYGAVYSVRAGAERHQPLALPGQEDGGELSYNIFRWYRAGWGRYTQSDPIGLRGGLNLFGYVHGNPIRFADPTGLVCGIDVWTEEVTYALDYGYDSGFKSNWGHQWITWPGGSAGFWPNPTPETPVQSVPGMVQIPDPKTKTKTKSEYKKSDTYFDAFKACPNCDATLKCVSNAALALQASPPNYCLVGYNCYSFVAEILGKCGLTTTSTFEQLESQK